MKAGADIAGTDFTNALLDKTQQVCMPIHYSLSTCFQEDSQVLCMSNAVWCADCFVPVCGWYKRCHRRGHAEEPGCVKSMLLLCYVRVQHTLHIYSPCALCRLRLQKKVQGVQSQQPGGSGSRRL